MKNVRLTLLDSNTVCRGRWFPQNGFYAGDGCVMFSTGATWCRWDDFCYYSKDGGRTWGTVKDRMERFHFTKLRDGSVFGVSYDNEVAGKVAREQVRKPYIMGVRRAQSFDALLEGRYEDDFAYTRIPNLGGACGDCENYFTGMADHGIAELPNGDILVTMYGHFRDDNIPVLLNHTESYQYRSWTVVSRDGGHSFEYLSTMADSKTWPISDLSEGYCEPDIKALSDGRLVGAMRTGGTKNDKGWDYTPAMAVTSFDGGITWSKPSPIRGYGVYPKIVQTANGAVIVSSGRDGIYLACSADYGATWQENQAVIVADKDGKCRIAPSGYTSLGAVSDNEILLLYDVGDETFIKSETVDGEEKRLPAGSYSKIMANRYRVDVE